MTDELAERPTLTRDLRSPPWSHYAFAMAVITLYIGYHFWHSPVGGGWFAILIIPAITYTSACLFFAAAPQRFDDLPPFKGCVGLVICIRNEDETYLRQMFESVAAQTRPVDEIWIVDDASEVPVEIPEGTLATLSRFGTGIGKRAALASVFRGSSEVDVWVTVDSDTILQPDAVENIIRPFSDPRNVSVSGQISGANWSKNLLTRVIDVEFTNSFLMSRTAYGKLGAVMVNCGGLAAYRASVINEFIEEYEHEMFFGEQIAAGDDRSLTMMSARYGRCVHAGTAVALTALPETLSHLVRQRVRWARSFYHGLDYVTRHGSPRKPVLWTMLWQMASFIGFSVAAGYMLLWRPAFHAELAPTFILYTIGLSYVRSSLYPITNIPGRSVGQRFRNWLLSPLVGILYITVLNPLRIYALFTCHKNRGWMTRIKVERTTAIDIDNQQPGD